MKYPVACLLLLCVCPGLCRDAARIRQELKDNMDVQLRPLEQTNVTTTLTLTSLNRLNSVTQELSTTFQLDLAWIDHRLSWDPVGNDPTELVFYVKEVWTPPLVVTNAVDDAVFLLRDDIVPLRVTNNGSVKWLPRMSPTTTCDINIARFPADQQTCYINITVWGHGTDEVNLVMPNPDDKKGVERELYNDLAWKLVNLGVTPTIRVTSKQNFSIMAYRFVFKRETLFYRTLVVIPFACLAFLMTLVFLIPSKYQQGKVSYSITLLLSFQMFLNLLQSLLPPVFNHQDSNEFVDYVTAVTIFGTIITGVLVIELVLIYLFRKYREPSIQGTVTGSIPGTEMGLLSGKFFIQFETTPYVIAKQFHQGEMKIDSALSTKSLAFSGSCTARDSRCVVAATEDVLNAKTDRMTFSAILTSSSDMVGSFKFHLSGLVVNNEIKDGKISGYPTKSIEALRELKCCGFKLYGYKVNVVLYLGAIILYAVSLVRFYRQLGM